MKQILQNLKDGSTELAEIPWPRLAPGHLLLHTTRTLISAGTKRMLVDFGKANPLAKARQQPDKVRQVLGVPCLTLRDTTERPETVTLGTNALIGTDPAKLGPAMDRLFAGQWQQGGIPPLWDGRTGERIVAALERLLIALP